MNCISCKNEHKFDFCPYCGQKSEVQRITLYSIASSGISTIINMDRGFLLNVKGLVLNPSEFVKDYLSGKRKNIFNPISFLIITISAYIILASLIDIDKNINNTITSDRSEFNQIGYEAGLFIKANFKYFWIVSVFWLSLSTKLIFGIYNYAEHLALNSFVIAQASILGLVVYMAFKVELLFNPILYLYITWMIYKIFKNQDSRLKLTMKSFGSTLLFVTFMTVFAFVIAAFIEFM